MNCYFCQRELDKDTLLIYRCKVCSGQVQHYYHQNPITHPESLWCVQMWVSSNDTTFLFLFYPIELKFRVYVGNADLPLVEFDYLPKITPNNVKEWADRFIKLKSFA